MRLIGSLETRNQTELFSAYLHLKGIPHQVDSEPPSKWAIWVQSEDQLEEARALLDEFRTNPNERKYHEAAQKIKKLISAQRKKRSRNKEVDVRSQWAGGSGLRSGRFTLILIGLSIAVAFLTKLQSDGPIVQLLSITTFKVIPGRGFGYNILPELLHGEVWRLITPALMHFGPLHIVMNLLWLKDLGGLVEQRQGSLRLVLMFFSIAAISNLAQFYMAGPSFAGMSGVVYGLLGYVWLQGKRNPSSGLYLQPWVAMMMGIWFLLCFTGMVGAIANTAHTVGLVMGLIWAFFTTGGFKSLRR